MPNPDEAREQMWLRRMSETVAALVHRSAVALGVGRRPVRARQRGALLLHEGLDALGLARGHVGQREGGHGGIDGRGGAGERGLDLAGLLLFHEVEDAGGTGEGELAALDAYHPAYELGFRQNCKAEKDLTKFCKVLV